MAVFPSTLKSMFKMIQINPIITQAISNLFISHPFLILQISHFSKRISFKMPFAFFFFTINFFTFRINYKRFICPKLNETQYWIYKTFQWSFVHPAIVFKIINKIIIFRFHICNLFLPQLKSSS